MAEGVRKRANRRISNIEPQNVEGEERANRRISNIEPQNVEGREERTAEWRRDLELIENKEVRNVYRVQGI